MKLLKKMLLQDKSPPRKDFKLIIKTIKPIFIMKTIYLCSVATLLLTINSYGQLDKKTWLVGGTGSFNSYKRNDTFTFQGTGEFNKIKRDIVAFEASSKVGYFVIDKLVVGLSSTFSREKSESTTITGSFGGASLISYNFTVGPFVRYYFLPKEKPYNLLAEVNYQIGEISYNELPDRKGSLTKFSFLVGPAIFFNSTVGMEFLLGYRMSNQVMDYSGLDSIKQSGFQLAIGFQIHLEKN